MVAEEGSAEVSEEKGQSTSETAPNFTLATLSGEELSLSDYRGQIVMVNFWASWCPPCNAEMPAMEAFYQTYQDEGFAIIAVNVKENHDTVQTFVDEKELTFPVALDASGETAARYGISGMPTSFFVAPDGTLLGYWPGAITQEMLEQEIAPLLQEQ